ncbi:MAG: preprotein translocase subunit YajC [Bacteroidetes bacterium]|nr:preprotein translocase subunit YajC [Bacteroidota bacterium]
MFINILLQGQSGSVMMQVVFLVAIIVVFYFFMIRPQMRKQKAEQNFRTTLEKGAKIVTIGGIHGRIVEVSDKTFLVEVDSNVKMRIEKSAISAEATKALDQSK